MPRGRTCPRERTNRKRRAYQIYCTYTARIVVVEERREGINLHHTCRVTETCMRPCRIRDGIAKLTASRSKLMLRTNAVHVYLYHLLLECFTRSSTSVHYTVLQLPFFFWISRGNPIISRYQCHVAG